MPSDASKRQQQSLGKTQYGASIATKKSLALTELRGSDSEFLVVAVKVCV